MDNSIKKLTEAYSSIYSDQLNEKAWWDPGGAFESPEEKAGRESVTKGKVATSGGVPGRIDPKTGKFVPGNLTKAAYDNYVYQRGTTQIATDKADVAAVTLATSMQQKMDKAKANAAPSAPILPLPTQTAQTPTKPSATPATPTKPAIEKSPQGYAVGTTAGGTKFERRAATGEELRAAQRARASALASGKSKPDAEEAAVKAGVARSQPTTGPNVDLATAQSNVKDSIDSFTARNMTTNPLKSPGNQSVLSQSGGVGPVGIPATKSELPLGTKVPVKPVKKESRNIIRGYLMREGYTN